MKLLDTNIIMYPVGKPHLYKAPCQVIFKKAASNATEFNIDTELCQELLYVYGRRGERKQGLKTVESLIELFPNVFPMDKYPNLIARDAIHAAVVLVNGLEGIVSVDKVFGEIKGLKRFEP